MIGAERERSHPEQPGHVGGVRTFTTVALIGALAATGWDQSAAGAGVSRSAGTNASTSISTRASGTTKPLTSTSVLAG